MTNKICDNDCEHCDWVTCPKMEEETETITVSKGCLKTRKGRFVVYDVEYLKSHIDIEAKIYGQHAPECDDCISREEALIKLQVDAYNMGYEDGVEAYRAMMEIEKEEKWLTGGKCSGCGGDAPYWSLSTTYHKSAYCPSCGAKMEEDIEE